MDAEGLQEVGRVGFQGNAQHLLCDNKRPAMLVSDLLPGRKEHEVHILQPHRRVRRVAHEGVKGGQAGGEKAGGHDGGNEGVQWDVAKLPRMPPDAIAVGCWSLCGRNRLAIFDAITKSLKVFDFV